MSGTRPIGSVMRAIGALDLLADADRGLGVNELSRSLGVNASTASRLLATLEESGLVERAPDGRFRLGLRLITLADRVLARLDVRELARETLTRLVRETGETATLSVPGGEAAVTVDFVPSPSSVGSIARLGRPSVLHATATGKVMLAWGDATLPEGRRLARFTKRTICDRAALAADLRAVRERGYADCFGERELDLNALAAPIFDRDGRLAAMLGLQGPASRLDEQECARLVPRLLQAAAALTRAMGGPARPWAERGSPGAAAHPAP